ncbi:MAG: recombinase family protein [Flexilinea sp.]
MSFSQWETKKLQKKSVHLVSNQENIDTSTPTGKLILTMVGCSQRV